MNPDFMRADGRARGNVFDLPAPALPVVRDLSMPGPAGPIALRRYDARAARTAPCPVVLFFHGSGFVLGDLSPHDALCAAIAAGLDLPLVYVDYRLAPDHPWPAGAEDCEAAARWIAAHPDELGIGASALVLAGDNAGNCLAVSTPQYRARRSRLNAHHHKETSMYDFKNKTAIVTGGAQGMGREYVRLLLENGANVVIADVNANVAQATVAALDAPGRVAFVHTDVSSLEACAACVQAAEDRFGGLDFLINNAGLLSAAAFPSLIDIPIEKYHQIMGVMQHGQLWMARAAVPAMRKRGGGAIVNVSSIGAYQATGIYSLTKLGVNGLTINLSRELAKDNIRVNAIAPGTVATEGMQPLMSVEGMAQWGRALGRPTDRVATPDLIARVGMFLLSDEAAYVRGQIIAVDDGQQIRV
ncbi:SDR family oxidoreductase [Massilia putida]|uniref:SDR family oxidoreductase n=1 Tax=Massilia putida TaxID=1141883 RepID=UPI0009F836CA|nr:SDR family oxidoreductase [Massilia putida]